MALIQSLLQAVRSLRRRRAGIKPQRRTSVALERLDHRQLLSVNFTGNVITDFPAPGAGSVRLPFNPATDAHATFSDPTIQSLVKASGFDLDAIWVSYDPQDDTLSVGLEQPLNQKTNPQRPVIAGDADNDLNSAAATVPGVIDFPDLRATEFMAAFLSFRNNNTPDVIAGFPEFLMASQLNDPKPYEVANVQAGSTPPFLFGTALPENTGTVFLQNSPTSPNLEFTIANFSRLYLARTGQTLNPNSMIGIGAQAGSTSNPTLADAIITTKPFTIGQAVASRCPSVDLALTKAVDKPRVDVNGTVTFTVTVTNTSPWFADTGVAVRDVLPPGFQVTSSAPGQGTFNPATGIWQVGSLPAGGGATLTITGQPTFAAPIINTATISGSDLPETNLSNNTATASVDVPPLKEPPILINPHQHRHVNTAHATDVHVYVLGSATFDVNQIIPETVALGGAHPFLAFTRRVNRDPFPDRVFVFKGNEIHLPPGLTNAVVTGRLTNGTMFRSIYPIFNRDASFYSPRAVAQQAVRQEQRSGAVGLAPMGHQLSATHHLMDAAIAQTYGDGPAASLPSGPTVRIARRQEPRAARGERPPVVSIATAGNRPIAPRQPRVRTGHAASSLAS